MSKWKCDGSTNIWSLKTNNLKIGIGPTIFYNVYIHKYLASKIYKYKGSVIFYPGALEIFQVF